MGQHDIHQRIMQLNFRDCHAKIKQVDSLTTLGEGVVIQVTGELSNAGQPMRRFMQTFVLAPQQPLKYYVRNDIFRYQDEVFTEEEEEDDTSSAQQQQQQQQTPEDEQLMAPSHHHAHPEGAQADSTAAAPLVNDVRAEPLGNGGASPPSNSVAPTPGRPAYFDSQVDARPETEGAVAEVDALETPDTLAASKSCTDRAGDTSLEAPTPSLAMLCATFFLAMRTSFMKRFCAPNACSVLNFTPRIVSDYVHDLAGYFDLLKYVSAREDSKKLSRMSGQANEKVVNSETEQQRSGEKQTMPRLGATLLAAVARQQRGHQPGGRFGGDPLPGSGLPPRPDQAAAASAAAAPPRASLPQAPKRPEGARGEAPLGEDGAPPLRPGAKPQYPDNQQVFVGNLPHSITEDQVRKRFEEFGHVLEFRINSKPTGKMTAGGKAVPVRTFPHLHCACQVQGTSASQLEEQWPDFHSLSVCLFRPVHLNL
ncbi:hypothetical protein HPB48_003879 [Haemaphysalis longicornis]|uniref:Ras GTPase-activating protein-binding protein 2 n=1 Tax=Haemaphysalis longicornis TaxID=44386 RepID=A0A9J6FFF7_HAELO|nr:hypothetical protein HPB48_003879 [Haemaphysalis longicornis]